MTVNYLGGNATASATGLFVISRHIARHKGGCKEENLQRSLQLLQTNEDGPGAILQASLSVGEAIGLLHRKDGKTDLAVDPELGKALEGAEDPWALFRGELLRIMNEHALAVLAGKSDLPDLIRALALFAQIDPLSPLTEDWGKGTEEYFERIGSNDVANSTQWRSFKRWAVSLGLARRAESTKPGVIVADASTAIADQLHALPASGSAQEWLVALRERLPLLGAEVVTNELPEIRSWEEVPPAVVLGLLKLERVGRLVLEPTDDASDVIAVGLGTMNRQIGRIKVEKSGV